MNTERIKRRYFEYMREARGHGEASIDGIAKALHRFETYTKFRDFKKFHIEQAVEAIEVRGLRSLQPDGQ